jgi:fluoroquinolone transport system ATP-binding protein
MIRVENLRFSYTPRKPFIEGADFSVGRGEIFGFLGPSGAGKSTLQKILTGFLKNYEGRVVVGGTEMRRAGKSFYERIGIDFEFPSLYERLTAAENLKFFRSLYSGDKVPVVDLLAMVGIERDGDKRVSDYSKGMKSRLNFIKALVHKPEVIFLDEPTSGLDPANSRVMKRIIADLRAEGRTIILTTHNMRDAAELCDRVAFIIDGHMKALDTP